MSGNDDVPLIMFHGTCDRTMPFNSAIFNHDCRAYPIDTVVGPLFIINNISPDVCYELHTFCGFPHSFGRCNGKEKDWRARKKIRYYIAEKTADFFYDLVLRPAPRNCNSRYALRYKQENSVCNESYCSDCADAYYNYDDYDLCNCMKNPFLNALFPSTGPQAWMDISAEGDTSGFRDCDYYYDDCKYLMLDSLFMNNFESSDEFLMDVFLYPNPSTGSINYVTGVSWQNTIHITVYNLIGQAIKYIEINAGKGIDGGIIDLSGLAGGIYLLKFQSEKISVIRRVILE